MLGNKLSPLVVFFLVCSRGNLSSTGIEYRADRQAGFSVLVGFRFQAADTNYRDVKTEGQSFGGADTNP